MVRGKGEGSIYKDGQGYWTATIELPSHIDGKRRRKVIRSKDKRVLMEKLEKARAEKAKNGGDLPTSRVTVEQWFTHWLTHIAVKELRPKTMGSYRAIVGNHVVPPIGAKRIDAITPTIIRAVLDKQTDAGLSSTYSRNTHAVMSAAFDAAMREGVATHNPVALVARPRKAVTDLHALTLTEGLKVLESAAQDPAMGACWATSLLTGARRGEVLGIERDRVTDVLDLSWQLQRLTWEHGCQGKCGRKRGADCPERTLNVPADYEYRQVHHGLYLTRPKSKAGWRIVPLVDPLKGILQRHIEATQPSGLIFTNNGVPLDPDDHSANWRTTLAASGIKKNVRLHDVRHTTVDLLYLAGVPEDLIIEIVGHSSRSMSQAYKSKRNLERLTAAMEQFSALFTPQIGERSTTPEQAALTR